MEVSKEHFAIIIIAQHHTINIIFATSISDYMVSTAYHYAHFTSIPIKILRIFSYTAPIK